MSFEDLEVYRRNKALRDLEINKLEQACIRVARQLNNPRVYSIFSASSLIKLDAMLEKLQRKLHQLRSLDVEENSER